MELQQEKAYTEEEYYNIDHNGLVEYDNGRIILHATPSTLHQDITGGLFALFRTHLVGKICRVFIAPFDVRLELTENNIKHVEPDISIICDRNKITDRGCNGSPDLIIEVVSPGSKKYDYLTKANWYEQAGVREYWIIDPTKQKMIVYKFTPADIDMQEYTFKDIVPVGIWNDEFAVDFSTLDLL